MRLLRLLSDSYVKNNVYDDLYKLSALQNEPEKSVRLKLLYKDILISLQRRLNYLLSNK